MSQDQPIPDEKRGDSLKSGPPAVVAFDFDGTLTSKDSFTSFLRWRAGPMRWCLGLLRLLPAGLAYLLHRDRGEIKAAALREFLRGTPRAVLEADAARFAQACAHRLLRPDAEAAWKRWRDDDVRVAIVTASPDLVVAPFARALGADVLIATCLAFDPQDRLVGALMTPNCRGPEKVRRLKAEFGDDVVLKAAYGDTEGDREMLEMAEIKGYRVFKEVR